MVERSGVGGVAVGDEPRIELTETPSVAQLIDLCAELYALDIEYDPQRLSERLTIRSGGAYSRGELWGLMNQMLERSGYTTVVAPGDRVLYRVVPINEAFGASADLEGSVDPSPGYTRRVYVPEHAGAAAAVDAIGGLGLPETTVELSSVENGLRVGTLTRLHREVWDTVSRLDEDASTTVVALIELVHAAPEVVLGGVNEYLREDISRGPAGSLGTGPTRRSLRVIAPRGAVARWERLVGYFDVPDVVETRTYSLEGFLDERTVALIERVAREPGLSGSGESWRVVTNELTGTLLLTATPREHESVRGFLEELRALPSAQLRSTEVIVVQNREAGEVASSLGRMMGVDLGGGPQGGAGGAAGERADQARGSGLASGLGSGLGLGSGPAVFVDEGLNAIIVTGTPREIERAELLVRRLDVRQPQVHIEIFLVSLSSGDSLDLGVELSASLGDSGTLVGLSSLFGLSGVTPSDASVTTGGLGGTAVVLDPGDYAVVVRAIERVSEGRSVSRANALVNNNESANVSNTVNQPFATTTLDDGDSITGFGGSESAGTTITVTPQIAEGEFLVLTYDVSLSAFLGESTTDGLPPPSQDTSLSSVATIPDGYAIALGGLELQSDSDADTKTPLLGDIPVLGALFRSQTESSSNTKFYLIIRASIMRHPQFERLKYASDRVMPLTGVDDGWPVVEPEIIR